MSGATLSVVVQDAAGLPDTPQASSIRAWVRAAAAGSAGEVTVRIVTRAESAELNGRYRGGEGPTNVLAFPAAVDHPDLADEPAPIGDVVVCAEVLARECREQGKSSEAHWAHIVVHGTLHLLGYDHDTEPAAERMEDRERELLAGMGFADPYVAG